MTHLVAALAEQLVGFLPAGLRVAGVAWFAPGLGSERAPAQVRVALAIALAVVVVPVAVGQPTTSWRGGSTHPPAPVVSGPGEFIALCLSELAFGIALGFAVAALLEAFRFGGEVLDLQVGLRAGQLFDPSTGAQSGILSTAYYMMALILFVQLNGHHLLLRGLAASFTMTPVGTLCADPGLQRVVCDVGRSMLALGLTVAGPVIAALLLADLALGLVARAVPQVNVFLVGIPGKIALGFAIAVACAPLLAPQLRGVIEAAGRHLDLMIRAFG